MSKGSKLGTAAALGAAVAALTVAVGSSSAHPPGGHHEPGHGGHSSIQHVLLISVDGLHESDLQ